MPIKFSVDKKMIITACLTGAVLLVAAGKYILDQGYFQEETVLIPMVNPELKVSYELPTEKIENLQSSINEAEPKTQGNQEVNTQMSPVLWAEPTIEAPFILDSSVKQIESYRVELELLNLELAIAQKKSQIQEINTKGQSAPSEDIKTLLAQLQLPQQAQTNQQSTKEDPPSEQINLPVINSSAGMKIVGIQTSGTSTTATIKLNGQERTYKVGDELLDTTVKSISQKKVELANGKTISWF